MIRHAARPVTFATGVTRDRRQIRVEFEPLIGIEERATFLRAEDDVDDHEA
jgi:hypothetical protein